MSVPEPTRTVRVACDKGMIVALLRNWHPNRLHPEWIRLATLRPQLLKRQDYVCTSPDCLFPGKRLTDDGKETEIDHIRTVEHVANEVISGKLQFDEAYVLLWAPSNLRAVHRECNQDRKRHKNAEEILSP